MKTIVHLLLTAFVFVSCTTKKENVAAEDDAQNLNAIMVHQLTDVKEIDLKDLPKSIQAEGDVKFAIRFLDKDGENYIVYSELTKTAEGYELPTEGKLFYERFLYNGNGYDRVWKIYDFEPFCDFGGFVFGNYIPVKITDLDGDGFAEIWTMYQTDCMGDVNPAKLKMIAYNKDKKYAVRGKSTVRLEEGGEIYGGEYTLGEGIVSADKVFKDFAVEHWKKMVTQSVNEKFNF